MKVGVDWKRDSDKTRRFSMEFNSLWDLNEFIKKFLESDINGEILNLRIFKIKGDTKNE